MNHRKAEEELARANIARIRADGVASICKAFMFTAIGLSCLGLVFL